MNIAKIYHSYMYITVSDILYCNCVIIIDGRQLPNTYIFV